MARKKSRVAAEAVVVRESKSLVANGGLLAPNERRLNFGERWAYAPAPEQSDYLQIKPRYQLFIDGKFRAPHSGSVTFRHNVDWENNNILASLMYAEDLMSEPFLCTYSDVLFTSDVVKRLLANPAYGERWAQHWLDLARYADTSGYHFDGVRFMWLWRDWVINAFNNNK
jgi:hypothetical protein